MSLRSKSKALVEALNDFQDRETYLSRSVRQALQELQKELAIQCDDFGRCNCAKGYCDKGLKT